MVEDGDNKAPLADLIADLVWAGYNFSKQRLAEKLVLIPSPRNAGTMTSKPPPTSTPKEKKSRKA